MKAHELLSRLDGVRNQSKGWVARCPAHEDKKASLSINEGEKGVLLKCFVGCSTSAICEALGFFERDLFYEETRSVNEWDKYPIKDINGRLVAIRKRKGSGENKKMAWESPNGKPKLDVKTCDLPLYGSELLSGFNRGRWVELMEGEAKTYEARSLGAQALGTSTGASVIPSREVLESLRGCKVRLWPDNDEPGRQHMKRIAQELRALGIECVVLDTRGLPHKGDAVQWIEAQLKAGTTKAQLKEVLQGDELPGLPRREASHATSAAQVSTPEPEETLPQGAILRRFCDVATEPVDWLCQDRIPRGFISMLVGEPGVGKSTLAIDLLARMTTGRGLPGEPDREPANGIYITAEDSVAHTLRPRAEAAGADLSRLFEFVGVRTGKHLLPLSSAFDFDRLEEAIRETKAALVVIDPLMAFLGKANSSKDQEVREGFLSPLARIAAATGAAVLILNHLRKGEGSAIQRCAGSVGIVGAARSVLLLSKEPDNEGHCILAGVKSNLGPLAPSQRLQLVSSTIPGASLLLWRGDATHTADSLTSVPDKPEEKGLLDEATEVLRQILSAGKQSSAEAKRQARAQGVAEKTLWRAKLRLGVKATKEGSGPWYWILPAEPSNPATTNPAIPPTSAVVGSLGLLDHLGQVQPIDDKLNPANPANPANAKEKLDHVLSNQNNSSYLKPAKMVNPGMEEAMEARPQEATTQQVPNTDPTPRRESSLLAVVSRDERPNTDPTPTQHPFPTPKNGEATGIQHLPNTPRLALNGSLPSGVWRE
jgi:putative DNA primase/helicase